MPDDKPWEKRKHRSLVPKKLKPKMSDEEAMKRVLYAEIMSEIRNNGKVRDEVRRVLDNLPAWTPFEDVTHLLSSPLARQLGITDPVVVAKMQAMSGMGNAKTRVYQNSRYIVHVTPVEPGFRLSIRTLQNDARHDWREYQRIKNELCGPEYEAIEVYPAESRLVDTANQFFLFVLPEGVRIPVGFDRRAVMRPDNTVPGANQRPWEPGAEPSDVMSPAQGISEALLRKAQEEVARDRAKTTEE